LVGFDLSKIIHDRSFTICGTPYYMAPEIMQNKGYNNSVDWWSFGVTVYEMTMGHTPYSENSDDMATILERVTMGEQPERTKRCVDFKLWDLTKKLLNIDSVERVNFAQSFKSHFFFRFFRRKRLNWNDFYSLKVKPPYIPRVDSNDDTSNFNAYADV